MLKMSRSTYPSDTVAQPDINSLQQTLTDNLTRDGLLVEFSLGLAAKRNNGARVKHCYQYMQRYNLLPIKPPSGKSDLLSADYRSQGNKSFSKKQDLEALCFYTNALSYADTPKLLSLAFANRSAVLYSLKKYEKCLIDIERAFEAGYDDDLKPKLEKRKELCKEALKNVRVVDVDFDVEEARQKIFKISEKRMDGVPCASASLEISYSPIMGRCVLAAEDILPGQVLVVENPYLTSLGKDHLKTRCYYCCSLNDTMIPCKECPCVMFCNGNCFTKSWDLRHKYECPIMSRLITMNFNKMELLSLRVLLQARCQHLSWKELFKTIDLAEKIDDPKLKGFVNENDTLIYDSKYYTSIHMFETNLDKRDNSDVFHRCVASAALLDMLNVYTDIFDDCPIVSDLLGIDENEHLWRAGGLMFHHNMTSASNMHSITALTEVSKDSYMSDSNFASGAYAFLSLINHSCCPNVGRVHHGTTIVMIALRPINKGQQVFDNYGYHHALSAISVRRSELQHQYKFMCKCEACLNSWPSYLKLENAILDKKDSKKYNDIMSTELIQKLESGDKEVSYNIIGKFYKNAAILEKHAPCKQLSDVQETIKQCWALFGNIQSFYYSTLSKHFESPNL